MDTYPFIAAAAAAVIVVPEQDRVLLVGRRKGNPFPERVFRPSGGRQTTAKRWLAPVLRTSVRRPISGFITPLCPNYRELGPFPLMG